MYHRWLTTLLSLAIGTAVLVSFRATIDKPDFQDMDYGAYYRAAVAVAHGESPYALDAQDTGFPPRAARLEGHGPLGAFPYAPAYAYLFLPLNYVDYLWGCRAWLLVNWLCTFLLVWLTIRLVAGESARGNSVGVLALTLIAMAGYLWANLRLGQVATLMVLGCTAWVWFSSRQRRFTAGLFLAAAAALKLAPLAFVPYLFVKRDWQGLLGFATGAMAFFLLPLTWVGWNDNLRLHQEWLAHTRLTDVPIQTYRPGNQSLLAQLARLPPIGDGHHCFSPEKLDDLKRFYPFLIAGLLAALCGWMLIRPVSRSEAETSPRCPARLETAILFVFMTLAHPHAWRCNFVGLLLPCAMLANHACHRRPGMMVTLGALSVVAIACPLPTHGVGEHGWNLAAWLILGKHFWGGLAVGAACMWCIPRESAETGFSTRVRSIPLNQPERTHLRDAPRRSLPWHKGWGEAASDAALGRASPLEIVESRGIDSNTRP